MELVQGGSYVSQTSFNLSGVFIFLNKSVAESQDPLLLFLPNLEWLWFEYYSFPAFERRDGLKWWHKGKAAGNLNKLKLHLFTTLPGLQKVRGPWEMCGDSMDDKLGLGLALTNWPTEFLPPTSSRNESVGVNKLYKPPQSLPSVLFWPRFVGVRRKQAFYNFPILLI